MEPGAQDSGDALPAAIIAQAEAACVGNADEIRSTQQRQSSQPHQETSGGAHSPRGASSSTDRTPQSGNPDLLGVEGTIDAPPKYSELEISQDGLDTKARVTDDGRVNITINQKTRRLSELLNPALRGQLSLVAQEDDQPLPPGYIPPSLGGQPGQIPPPNLNVVILVVGSRGDVQPFVALGKVLKSAYGHRIRLATHPVFQTLVEENGLEFFSIGGDPAELMAFMVKNPGLMPGMDALKSGDVGKRRKGMEEIVLGCWRACIEAGNGLGPAPKLEGGINMDTNPTERPFIADAIIANPPSFAHVHIAEKLGIPLHIMFTMPWSPTQSFPHPLANIQSSNADVNMTNFISYALVEMMTWQGLGDLINRFRERVLGLEPISVIWGPGVLSRLKIPCTYCWSPALIPKPKDWGRHISVSGFFFLSLASSYQPEPELAAFLAAGPPPVYIGFGSIVVDDPNSMTSMIFEAVQKAGVRALVSKGWGGLGDESLDLPEGVFMLGNVPHDWLFKHVSCVVHHGGAGTSAAGIALGKPTVVVPFFGDQPWWGAMIHRAGAGPEPIPYKDLTAEKLAAAIAEALKPSTLEKAEELGVRISKEKGSEVGGKSFHDHLDWNSLRCSLAPNRVAVWQVKKTQTRLSALAATVLANEGLLNFSDLKLYRPREYDTDDGPWDPISGGASALFGTIASLSMGVADFPVELIKAFKPKTTSTATGKTAALDEDDVPSPTGESTSPPKELTSKSQSQLSPSSGSQDVTEEGSKPTDRGSEQRPTPPASKQTKKQFDPSAITLESAIGASKGISRVVGAGMKSPVDFTLGLARGFHNAPKLYGDDTVRPQERVTDFQSGLKAAGKGFGYGFYDGISGLVTQPMRGAEKEGAAGLIKGIGRGIGGLVFKPGAAIWGLPGYTMMGLHKEVRKMFGASVQAYIISARTAQGYEQWRTSSKEEQQYIIGRWQGLKSKSAESSRHGGGQGKQDPNARSGGGKTQTHNANLDEDEEALRRAIEASIAHAAGPSTNDISEADQKAALEAAIQRSLSDSGKASSSTHANEDDEDAEQLKRAIEESMRYHDRDVSATKTDEDIVMEYIKKQSLAEEEHRQAMHNPTSSGSKE
ncbi:hypothetical protein V494_03176 [Pseudogymnoascus sp. VKM F-4513 (FW-928)]|nr:hypothetical protein V494_03176 [Pseudogymnoascus sp. VKM F-4513 (FW-928)]